AEALRDGLGTADVLVQDHDKRAEPADRKPKGGEQEVAALATTYVHPDDASVAVRHAWSGERRDVARGALARQDERPPSRLGGHAGKRAHRRGRGGDV